MKRRLIGVCMFALALVGACPAEGLRAAPVQLWLSTADGHQRLKHSQIPDSPVAEPATITIEPEKHYQQMVGFGAALTDASAWLIHRKLSDSRRQALLRELFGRADEGLGLSFMRLTIGASDFSLRHYSLDDMPKGESDPTFAHFSIAPSGDDAVSVTLAAMAINPQLRVMASPWSAPAWMKTTDSLIGGTLRSDMYPAFAEYLVRYIETLASYGVPIYALTVQNEPGFAPADYPGMTFPAQARARFVGDFLGPAMAKRAPATRILDWDHNWNRPDEPLTMLSNIAARHYVSGIAWHCYEGLVEAQIPVHAAFPDQEVYMTECSGGSWAPLKHDALLWMTRNLLIGATRGWAKGVLLWNIALDPAGDPHTGGCATCRGLVTIDSTSGEITRTVDYTVLAHASRFVRPGAWRVESNVGTSSLSNVAFRNLDDGSLVLIASNSAKLPQRISVRCGGRRFAYTMPVRSVATFTWD